MPLFLSFGTSQISSGTVKSGQLTICLEKKTDKLDLRGFGLSGGQQGMGSAFWGGIM